MAGEKLLSETQCKNAKPKAKVYYLNDGGGLRLRCRPDGSRTWVFRYRVNAKEKALGLGSYPVTTIAIARTKADENRNLIIAGNNPVAEKRANKVKKAISANQTFGAVAREWIKHNKEHWSTKHLNRNEGLIKLHLQNKHLPVKLAGWIGLLRLVVCSITILKIRFKTSCSNVLSSCELFGAA